MASGSSRIVRVSSNSQIDLFPWNRPSRFTNKLSAPITLSADWEVAVLKVQYLHQWDNFLKRVNINVMAPRARTNRMSQNNVSTVQNPSAANETWTARKPPPNITPEMLRAKKLTRARIGCIVVQHGNTWRRFDYWPDFPELERVQRFERVFLNDEQYDEYLYHKVMGHGFDRTMKSTRSDTLWTFQNKPIEEFQSRFRRVYRTMPDGSQRHYLQRLPVTDALLKPDPPTHPELDPMEYRYLYRYAGNEKVLEEAKEFADFTEVYDRSLDIKPATPSSRLPETEQIVAPWFDRHALQFQNYLNEIHLDRYVSARRMRIPRCYFSSLAAFCTYLCKELSRLVCDSSDNCVTYQFDEQEHMLSFSVSSDFTPLLFCADSNYLTDILGIDPVLTIDSREKSNEKSYVYEFPTVSKRPPHLHLVQTLHVYSDVGSYIETAGVLTPHLDSFGVDDRPGMQVTHVANPPLYVPVSRTYIDTVYIQLNDDQGEPPPFSRQHQNSVSVTLHFRNPKQS